MNPSGIAKSSTSFGWGKGGKVTSAGWQVTLCDPIWHVISRIGVVISIRNCYICVYFTFYCYVCTCNPAYWLPEIKYYINCGCTVMQTVHVSAAIRRQRSSVIEMSVFVVKSGRGLRRQLSTGYLTTTTAVRTSTTDLDTTATITGLSLAYVVHVLWSMVCRVPISLVARVHRCLIA